VRRMATQRTSAASVANFRRGRPRSHRCRRPHLHRCRRHLHRQPHRRVLRPNLRLERRDRLCRRSTCCYPHLLRHLLCSRLHPHCPHLRRPCLHLHRPHLWRWVWPQATSTTTTTSHSPNRATSAPRGSTPQRSSSSPSLPCSCSSLCSICSHANTDAASRKPRCALLQWCRTVWSPEEEPLRARPSQLLTAPNASPATPSSLCGRYNAHPCCCAHPRSRWRGPRAGEGPGLVRAQGW
jgi:hypothetical protein